MTKNSDLLIVSPRNIFDRVNVAETPATVTRCTSKKLIRDDWIRAPVSIAFIVVRGKCQVWK